MKYIQGKAYLTSVAMTCAVGEVLSAQVAFQANGAWTGGGDMSVIWRRWLADQAHRCWPGPAS